MTEARLEQGTREIGRQLERKHTGDFVKWLTSDVQKETTDELEVRLVSWLTDPNRLLVRRSRPRTNYLSRTILMHEDSQLRRL